MRKELDLEEEFNSYLYEIENFGTREERLFEEFQSGMSYARMLQWLEASFKCGAKAIADDTLYTLGVYGTAVAGVNEKVYTSTKAMDAAAENLEYYYHRVFKEKE